MKEREILEGISLCSRNTFKIFNRGFLKEMSDSGAKGKKNTFITPIAATM
jgi:hypothetical protein